MTNFKAGDRVLVADDARWSGGSSADTGLTAGPGTVTEEEDEDGDLRVRPDGDEDSYYVYARYVTREPKFVETSEIKVGDKIRVTDTLSGGDVVIRVGVVTGVTARRVETATQLLYADPKRTFEILESAPEPKKFKVGDTVEGQSNYDLLPVGVFLEAAPGQPGAGAPLFRTSKGWRMWDDVTMISAFSPRVIVWLPKEKENA